MLHDRFSRRLSYLRLSVTDLCNFRCIYCLPNGYQGKAKKNELSVAEITTAAAAFARCGTRKIRITGGEPTLRVDLPEIVRACKDQKGIKTVALTTNAYRLSKKFPALEDAGLDALNISIDSFNPGHFHEITGKNELPRIMDAIDMILDRASVKLKINTLLLRDYSEGMLEDALDFVKNRSVTLRFIELMHTPGNHVLFLKNTVQSQTWEKKLMREGWMLLKPEDHAGPAREYAHPDYRGKIGWITPYSEHFCTTCNRLRLTAQGKLHLCLFAAQACDIRPFLQANDTDGLVQWLPNAVAEKPKHHFLMQGKSGLIHDLSMTGG